MWIRPLGMVALCALSCKGGSRAAPAPVVEDAGPVLRILVDGEPAAEVAVGSLASRPPLESLVDVPRARWRQLAARGDAGPTMHATRLDDVYRDQDAILFLDGGRPALGMFRRVAPDATDAIKALALNPTNALAGITEVRIHTEDAPRPEPPPQTKIELRAGDRRCVVDDAALATLQPAVRGRDSKDRASWDVRDLARHCFGATPTAVRAPGLDVDAATLARADRQVVVKINRRGQLKLRLIEPAEGRPKVVTEVLPAHIEVAL